MCHYRVTRDPKLFLYIQLNILHKSKMAMESKPEVCI